MSLLGVFILSPDSLLIRLAGLADHSLLFYRGLFPMFTISLLLWFYYRTRFVAACLGIGWAGLLNGVLFATTNITFISAIQLTSVANTLLILSSAPIFAALLSLLVLAENQRPATWLVILLSFIGIFIIGLGSYGSSGLMGDIFALACAIVTACSAVLVRYKKQIDLVPSVIVGSFLTACYALAMSTELTITATQLAYLSIIGFILVPFAFIILTIAPRYANSAEVQLVYLLESILGPLWVWLVITETPSTNTIIGGSLLLASVAWFVRRTIQQESARV